MSVFMISLQTNITDENVEDVASELALITTQTSELEAEEIDDVAESLESIANTNSSSPNVGIAETLAYPHNRIL